MDSFLLENMHYHSDSCCFPIRSSHADDRHAACRKLIAKSRQQRFGFMPEQADRMAVWKKALETTDHRLVEESARIPRAAVMSSAISCINASTEGKFCTSRIRCTSSTITSSGAFVTSASSKWTSHEVESSKTGLGP